MAKSKWKSNFLKSNFFKKLFLSKFKKIKISKIFCRSSIISKIFCKKHSYLYKGNIFSKILFNKYQIGFKIGEFSITRKPFSYPLKKSKR